MQSNYKNNEVTVINSPSQELADLATLDHLFWVAQSYPNGIIVANTKGSVRLDGVNLKLGHQFTIKTMTRGELIKATKPKSYFTKKKRK